MTADRSPLLRTPLLPRFEEGFLRKLEALAIVARRTRAGDARAERRSRRVGAGIEFANHREYAAGDDVRALDWNLLARLDRPYLRLREEDSDLTVSIMLDTTASMGSGSPPKLELAVRIAAALGYVGFSAGDRVGIFLVADSVHGELLPARGKGMVAAMLELLGAARAQGSTDLATATRSVHARARSSTRRLSILISDLLDPAGCLPVLNGLRAARQEVVVVQVTADSDGTAPEEGEVLLQDVETGETRPINITGSVRKAHAERYQALLRGIAGTCRSREIACLQIPSQTPFESAALRILRAGGILG